MSREESAVFNAWFDKLSIEEQREYVNSILADYDLMLQSDIDY